MSQLVRCGQRAPQSLERPLMRAQGVLTRLIRCRGLGARPARAAPPCQVARAQHHLWWQTGPARRGGHAAARTQMCVRAFHSANSFRWRFCSLFTPPSASS